VAVRGSTEELKGSPRPPEENDKEGESRGGTLLIRGRGVKGSCGKARVRAL